MPGDIDIEVLHPVPVRWAPRATSAERLWFEHVTTATSLRAVPPGSFRPIMAVGSSIPSRFPYTTYEHDGRVWTRYQVMDADARPGRPATLDEVAAILGGEGPIHVGRAVHPGGSPLTSGDAIMPNAAYAGLGRLPDRVHDKAVEDLSDAARSRIAAFFEREIAHDGSHAFVCVPPPMMHALSGEREPVPIFVPGSGFGWAGSPGLGSRREGYAAFARSLLGTDIVPRVHEAADALANHAGLGDPDADIACFLTQVPHFLWKSWNALSSPRHERNPDALDLVPAAEARMATIRALAARASVGLLAPPDHAGAAEAVSAVAAALAKLHPYHGLRNRFREVSRYVDIVVMPGLLARDPGAAADADDLAALAP